MIELLSKTFYINIIAKEIDKKADVLFMEAIDFNDKYTKEEAYYYKKQKQNIYTIKEKLIKTLIKQQCFDDKLKICIKEGIIYFEYKNKQIGFHFFNEEIEEMNYNDDNEIKWIGYKHELNPFNHLLSKDDREEIGGRIISEFEDINKAIAYLNGGNEVFDF